MSKRVADLLVETLQAAGVKPTQVVTPPSPLVSPEAVSGMALYSVKAVLQGRGDDVWDVVAENLA
jgi:pyruvate dehydrogenase (quinone)